MDVHVTSDSIHFPGTFILQLQIAYDANLELFQCMTKLEISFPPRCFQFVPVEVLKPFLINLSMNLNTKN